MANSQRYVGEDVRVVDEREDHDQRLRQQGFEKPRERREKLSARAGHPDFLVGFVFISYSLYLIVLTIRVLDRQGQSFFERTRFEIRIFETV